jgi:hypothetical protein
VAVVARAVVAPLLRSMGKAPSSMVPKVSGAHACAPARLRRRM